MARPWSATNRGARSLVRALRVERLEPRLALSAGAPDCGCGLAAAAASETPSAAISTTTDDAGANEQFSGVVTAYALDWLDGSHTEEYWLAVDSGSLRLDFLTEIPDGLTTGWQIDVVGQQHAGEIDVMAINVVDQESATGAREAPLAEEGDGGIAPKAILNRQTLVIPVNFTDASLSCSVNDLNNTIFQGPQSVAAFYEETTYGNESWEGDVAMPVTIPYNTASPCDYVSWGSAALDEAASNGVDIFQYEHFIYALPQSTCPLAGIAVIGGSESWNFNRCSDGSTFAHELGHNLGARHADKPGIDGGDLSSIMGFPEPIVHFNATQKLQGNWIPVARKTIVSTNGTFQLSPLESLAGTSSLAITVQKAGLPAAYNVSYRRPIGFDQNLAPEFQNKVLIQTAVGSTGSLLHQVLSDGQLFSDEVHGVWIKMLSHNDQTAYIQVSFDGPPLAGLAGDYNRDTLITPADHTFWAANFGATSGVGLQADGNSDGVVDAADYNIWRDNYAPPPSTPIVAAASAAVSVPEVRVFNQIVAPRSVAPRLLGGAARVGDSARSEVALRLAARDAALSQWAARGSAEGAEVEQFPASKLDSGTPREVVFAKFSWLKANFHRSLGHRPR